VPSTPEVHISRARERRQHPRCRVIDSNIVPVDLGRARRALLVDLSIAGASVEPYAVLETGEVSRVQFEFPGSGSTFEAECVVKWTGTSGRAGIKFLNLANSAKECLKTWIDGFNGPSAGLPTQSSPQASAAYLPPSFSPWLRTRPCSENAPDELETEIASLDLVSALRLVCDRARSLTQGSGAAIALSDGRDVVCRARAGVAPELGARFKAESGLSGEAVRTGATVMCADTSRDPRVDRIACEQLNIGAVLIVPIMTGSAVIGVIEVFSSEASSFDDGQLCQVQRLAELISAMLENGADVRQRDSRNH